MEQLITYFVQAGYQRIEVNVPGIYVFFKKHNETIYTVSLYSMISGTEFSPEQYAHIEHQIMEHIQEMLGSGILISLLVTKNPGEVKQLVYNNKQIGVIDLSQNRLILYDEVTDSGLNLFRDLERLLSQTKQSSNGRVPAKNIPKIEPINAALVVSNLLIFILLQVSGLQDKSVDYGALYWPSIKGNHEYYRIITSMFLHGDIQHILNNMLILACIGNTLEKITGKLRYLIIYFGSGLVAGLTSMSYNMEKVNDVRSIGASGAIFGIVGAMLYIVLIYKGKIDNLGKRQMLLFAVLSLYGGFVSNGVDNVAHVGGIVAGFVLALLLYRKPGRKE